jgi:tetratricopeptide (TPR) repeat protein
MYSDMSMPTTVQPFNPSATATPAAKVPGSRLELQEDFGRVIRRIMYSNTGDFQAVSAPAKSEQKKTFYVENAEWSMCRIEAQLAGAQKKYEMSELLWLRALEIASTFSAGDPRLPQTLDELASLYFARKQYEKAESFSKQALEICKKSFGAYHPKVAYCANNLAGIYFCQQFYKKAEPLCLEVLNIYSRIYEPNHADVGMAHGNLAMLFKHQEKFKLALEHCAKALPIRTVALGANHHMVRTLDKMHIELLYLCGEQAKADLMREQAESKLGWKLFDSTIVIDEGSNSRLKRSLKNLI